MRRFKIPGKSPDAHVGISPSEKKRLLLLVVATVFVAAALAILLAKTGGVAERDARIPAEEPIVEQTTALPEIDAGRVGSLVADDRPEDRVVLESQALDLLLEPARLLTERHFEAMDPPELDAGGVARLVEERAARRAAPFTARGWIETLRKRHRGPANSAEYVGRLILQDDSTVYFVVAEMQENLIEGDFARVDGLFLKVFSEESDQEAGRWIEGPLLVGPRAIRSFPALGTVSEIDVRYRQSVHDDVLMEADGSRPDWQGLPFDALWHMMAYARDLPPGAFDWESAPELDREALAKVFADGAAYRFQPFRIPISRLQDVRVKAAGENPARIEEYTSGWIGNTTWNYVIYFQSPDQLRELRLRDYVYGNGFFVKNFAYASSEHGVRLAPAFVMHSLVRHDPQVAPIFEVLAYTAVATAVLLMAVISFLLLREKRRSRQLQGELLRRRRARRERDAARPAGPVSP